MNSMDKIKQTELQIEMEYARNKKLFLQKLGFAFCLISGFSLVALGAGLGFDINWLSIAGGTAALVGAASATTCAMLHDKNKKKQQSLKQEMESLRNDGKTQEKESSKDVTKSFTKSNKKQVVEEKEEQDALEL